MIPKEVSGQDYFGLKNKIWKKKKIQLLLNWAGD